MTRSLVPPYPLIKVVNTDMKRLPWTTCLLGHKHTNRKIFSLPPGVSHDDDYKTEVNQQKTKIFESHIGAPQSPEMVAKCDYTAVWSHHRLFSCHALCNTCCRQRWQSSLNKGERYIEKLMDMLLKQPFWFTGYWLKTTNTGQSKGCFWYKCAAWNTIWASTVCSRIQVQQQTTGPVLSASVHHFF